MDIKAFLLDLFRDERGSISIKPVIAFIGSMVLCTTMVFSSVSRVLVDPSDALVNAVLVITCIGLGADSVDKFSYKKPTDPNNPPTS